MKGHNTDSVFVEVTSWTAST